MTVRDRLWLFASRAHDDDIWLGKGTCQPFFLLVTYHTGRGSGDA